IGGTEPSGPIPLVEPPKELNWEKWLGQAPLVDFRYKPGNGERGYSRAHYEFRWWYEYSGGKLTDWGAHHVDIAQWGIDQSGDGQGPTKIEPISFEHPVPFEKGHPTQDDQYNTATKFMIHARFPNGVLMKIRDDEKNGIVFTGDKGRFFVGRGEMAGVPVEQLKDHPLPDDALKTVYKGKEPTDHMDNFMHCVYSREEPVSDVASHVRALNTCHLAAIAIRLGRAFAWDPKAETITGDSEAQSFLAREQRKGYEIDVKV
ncbi:MAG: gfo/Idh/MocA family oxidoreductase, partial [Planctomycetaceae bacterium]